MSRPRLRALVLAAGRGERLRPLTATLPKPLLPVAGRPLAAWTLERLRAVGVEAVAMNLHHRGDAIRAAFGESFRGMPLVYSEERELLGTGGALPPLADFLAAAELVLIVNGDSLCRWPLERLLDTHRRARRRDAARGATVLVHGALDPRPYGGGAALEGERVVAFRPGALAYAAARGRAVFAGAQVLEPELVRRLRPGPSDLVDALYHPILAEGAVIGAVRTRRLWHDLGTPRRYLDAVLDWTFRGSSSASRVSRGAEVASGARLARTVVEAEVRIADRARLRDCLVLPGASCGVGVDLRRAIVGPGAEVPAGEAATDVLYHRSADGTTERSPIVA
jgi:NDP-sugar pyrophosphorylase family protein